MNMTIAIYLKNKARQSLISRGFTPPDVDLYDSAVSMLQGIWPYKWEEMWDYYYSFISDEKYNSAYRDGDELIFFKSAYRQPSLNRSMCLVGLATQPNISVTHEGVCMKDFTFAIFHEIAHIFYETRDEIICNSFALLYNNLLWATPAARKEPLCQA